MIVRRVQAIAPRVPPACLDFVSITSLNPKHVARILHLEDETLNGINPEPASAMSIRY
jgi:hypothetical protein